MMVDIPTDESGRGSSLYLRSTPGRLAALRALPWRQAWHQVRRVARQAVQQRMTTEMADLAVRIRKLQEFNNDVGQIDGRR